MDWLLTKSVNAQYHLSYHKCVKKTELLCSIPRRMPQVCHTPPKIVPPYSLGNCPPKTPPPSLIEALSLLHWENIDFLNTYDFAQSTWAALESPKIDICQNWPWRVLGDVISCLESKFDKKIPMGSVPNCRKVIPNHYGIRWFKCKLEPPKNYTLKIYDTIVQHKEKFVWNIYQI